MGPFAILVSAMLLTSALSRDPVQDRLCDASISRQPVYTPMSLVPMLKDPARAREVVDKAYPRALADDDVSGVAGIWFLIDTAGNVERALVASSSGSTRLDIAAREAALQLKFTAPVYRGKAVCAWVKLPIAFP